MWQWRSLHQSIPHGYGFCLACARVRSQMLNNALSYFVKMSAILLKDGDYMYKLALLVLLTDVPLS